MCVCAQLAEHIVKSNIEVVHFSFIIIQAFEACRLWHRLFHCAHRSEFCLKQNSSPPKWMVTQITDNCKAVTVPSINADNSYHHHKCIRHEYFKLRHFWRTTTVWEHTQKRGQTAYKNHTHTRKKLRKPNFISLYQHYRFITINTRTNLVHFSL